MEFDIPPKRASSVVIIDGSDYLIAGYKRALHNRGFTSVHVCFREQFSTPPSTITEADLVIIEIGDRESHYPGIEVLRTARREGYHGLAIVVSTDYSLEKLHLSALAEANDFFVDGPFLRIADEVDYILGSGEHRQGNRWKYGSLANLGFLRSCGLNATEIALLRTFADGLPRYRVLAKRTQRSEAAIRKSFSEIYSKLGLDSLPQVVQLVSFLCLF